jgi:tetratricopeptide (TPR) repeat protein
VWHSRLLIQDSDPGDYRPWHPPDIAAPLTSADYLNGRDPALEAILAFRPLPPLADSLDAAYSGGGLSALREAYRVLAPRYPATGRSTEGDLNRLGYLLLGRGKREDAIAVFELNVREHPGSYNVYDSLGDAYLRAGNRAAGLDNYRRSVELNPGNEHAKRVLAAAALEG